MAPEPTLFNTRAMPDKNDCAGDEKAKMQVT